MTNKTTDTSDWLDDLLNSFMEYTYSYAKGDIAMTENPPLLLARKTQQAIKEHIVKERTQAAIKGAEAILEDISDWIDETNPTVRDLRNHLSTMVGSIELKKLDLEAALNQQTASDYLNDPKNIAKAVEGSMDKRNEVTMQQKLRKQLRQAAIDGLKDNTAKLLKMRPSIEKMVDRPKPCNCAVCYAESQDNQQKGKL